MKNTENLNLSCTDSCATCGACKHDELVFPEDSMRWTYCCGTCRNGTWDNVRRMVWCGKLGHWYEGSDGCNDAED